MASESSSAVLDMNDADTEDTEATSVTDDADGVPLIMEHGYDIAVKVDAPMKQLSTLETFVTYRVRCACARWSAPPYVRRRYNHFKVLHKRLSHSHPLIAVPPLPPLHSARQQLDRYAPSFVAIRMLALHAFLDRVAKHPILTHSEDFRIFLTTPDHELDKVFKSENSAMNLWGLSSALYGSGESKSVNGPRVKDPEFTAAADYLQSLQQKLTTLCTLTTKLHKGAAALEAEQMNMKRVCDAWATQARGRAARAAGAVAAGAGGVPPPPAHAPAPAPRAHAHRALLPLLAAYAGAHLDKIRQRDIVHAAYISGTNTSDDLHNRLEQASEALRSELADWIPKTRSEIKSTLLDLAERQVNLHTQTLMGWEHALKLSTDANIDEIFKTVSKTAVQNLSPSKCRSDLTETETERDLDDLEIDSNDSTSRDVYINDEFAFDTKFGEKSNKFNAVRRSSTKLDCAENGSTHLNTDGNGSPHLNTDGNGSPHLNADGNGSTHLNTDGSSSTHLNTDGNGSSNLAMSEKDSPKLKTIANGSPIKHPLEYTSTRLDTLENGSTYLDPFENGSTNLGSVENGSIKLDTGENVKKVDSDDFIQSVLSDESIRDDVTDVQKVPKDLTSDDLDDSSKIELTTSEEGSKSNVINDPLRDFSDIDLS